MTTPLNPTGGPSVFGGIGRLEFSQGAPDDPFPVYTDITVFVRTEENPLVIDPHGRQTELDKVQSTQLVCTLDNTDGRFTFGNTSGPYGANWTPAKKVRYSETIGGRTFVLFTGWIEFPDVDNWQPIGYQEVRLTCTDRLTRLGRARAFVSTLGAQILAPATSASPSFYYPLSDAAGAATANPADGSVRLVPTSQVPGSGGAAPPSGITFGINDRPYGDDLPTSTRWSWPAFGATFSSSGYLTGTLSPALTWSGSDQLVLVAWVNPDVLPLAVSNSDLSVVQLTNRSIGGFVNLHAVGGVTASTLPGNWQADIVSPGAAFTGSVVGSAAATSRWGIIGAAFQLFPVQTLWTDDRVITANATGTPPSSMTFDTIFVGQAFQGLISHVQIYIGPPAFTNANFLAQRAVGLLGLESQLTGQRVNTILDYAGVPTFDRLVDPGVSVMQRATLAGQTPRTALQNAVDTERGRGFAGSDGRYVFHDRVRTLNL